MVLDQPSNGTLTFNADGNFVYVPNPGFTGVDTFTYQANDGTATASASVEIEVVSNAIIVQAPEEAMAPVEVVETTIIEEPVSEEVEERSEDDEENNNLDGSGFLANGPAQVPVVNLTERAEFQAEGETEDLLRLLTDQGQARAVLGSILANVQNGEANEIERGSELDEFKASNFGLQTVYDAGFLYEEIESQIDVNFDEFKFAVGAITSFGSLGYILWTLRGGALMAVAFAQMPSWRMIDPLPVLDSYAGGAGADDDEEFDDFFG